MLAAIVFVATSGCTWQQVPSASFRLSGATAHRRFTERSGLPISVGIFGANLHDGQALIPLVKGIPPIRSRRGRRRRKPAKLYADKGYDYAYLRRWLRERGITHRIARKGVESSQRLGRHRWTVERTMAWLAGCRRLHRRYERKADHFLAFTSIACTLICCRRLCGARSSAPTGMERLRRPAGWPPTCRPAW
ncbi:hypothetical protein GCM10010094_51380 [Streptomyces flaveus]|uniref:Transposase IS4-like domain-containing protein n=1 Tax=Streptomyces flaveus TaxID=66370 RepID=A0A917VIU7_9ACTN|nr:hypothetical protein GCM10010094_51380 [Streptomyces flaveus]